MHTDVAPTVHRIADCLSNPAGELTSFGYANGLLGTALFWTYYAHFANDDSGNERSRRLLTEAIRCVTQPYTGRNFPKELAELGIFLEYAKANNLLDIDTNMLLTGADQLLAKTVKECLARRDFDPYSGALSMGSYFIGRLPSQDSARVHMAELVVGLRQIAVTNEAGQLYWPSQLFGDDRIYLGLSHGTAAILVFLSRAVESGIQASLATDTIQRAVGYLLAQQQDYRQVGSFYPNIVGETGQPTRLGLCYGDMGVAYSLLRAARVLNDASLEQQARTIFTVSATRRSPATSGINDAGILYGAAGTALLFDKAYELTGQPDLDEAARYWYERIPEFAVHHNATAGFQGTFNQHFPHTNWAFMEGIAGIGVTLMKYAQRDNYSFNELIWLQ